LTSSVTDAVQTTQFKFDVVVGGYLDDGGAINPSLGDAYDGAYRLSVNDTSFTSNGTAFELADRQLVIGPQNMGSARVVRKLYVPPTGGYARYLEVVTNTDAVNPVTVSLKVSGNLGSDGGTYFYRVPADTGNRFATSYETSRSDPALAHVYASAGGIKPSEVQFANDNDNIFYRWDGISIPPGESRCVMHFAVQRKTYDEAVADAQAQALADLADNAMLEGLSDAERACIINFVP